MTDSLEQVCSRLDEAWIPVNPILHSRIQARLVTNGYKIDALIEELKADAALFSYTVKELSKKMRRMGNAPIKDPVASLRAAGYQTLKAILSREVSSVSIHDFHAMKSSQAQVLKNAVVGASVAELLAPSYRLSKDAAFSCSILRQLGLALIAWNYPSIYARALEKKEGRDIYLNTVLGFSPTALAFTLARKWGLSIEIRRGLGDYSSDELLEDPVSSQIGESLEKVCRVGEAIARYNDPQYPTPRGDWEQAREEIRKRLGGEGFQELQKRIAGATKYYVLTAPELFATIQIEESNCTVHEARQSLSERNPHILGCPPELREMLEGLYYSLEQNVAGRETLDLLLKRIIPSAGFSRGCIYLADIEYHLLIPKLAIGDASLDEFRPIRYNVIENKSNPIVRAFLGSMPVAGERRVHSEDIVQYMASSLGYLQKAGVLYLEAENAANELSLHDSHKTIFKSLRQALTDCLHLE